jgi:hypothetical protein
MAEPLLARRAVVAAIVGAALSAALIVGSSGAEVDRMTFGDGVLFRYVAQHLAAGPGEVDEFLGPRGPALRYGRIGLPTVLWLASAGQRGAMRYAQPLLMVLSAAAASAAAAVWLSRLRAPVAAVVPFLGFGFSASLAGGFAEPLAIALCLWAVVLAQRERWAGAAALLSLAMLMRENAALVAFGLAMWLFVNGRRRAAWMLIAAALPVVVWHVVVGVRFGHLPLTDPFVTAEAATGPPFVELWRSVRATHGIKLVQLGVHVAIAVASWRWWRSSAFAAAAAAAALAVTWTGPYTWGFVGDGARATAFMDVCGAMALVTWAQSRVPKT